MKKKLLFAALLAVSVSCNKDDNQPNTSSTPVTVKYTINPIDENIIDVRYNDQDGEFIIEQASVAFGDSSVQFNAASTPYLARVGLRFEDAAFSIDEYEVSIYVNGALKARDTIVNSGNTSTGEGYVEYLVE